jgi:hypothetical protein
MILAHYIEASTISTILTQGCQIFPGTTYQNGKNIQNEYKMYMYQMGGHKIYHLAIKYTIWT